MAEEKGRKKEDLLTLPQTRFFAGLFTNLAAGWYGLVILTPNFSDLSKPNGLWTLLWDIFFAILFSWMAIKFEERTIL